MHGYIFVRSAVLFNPFLWITQAQHFNLETPPPVNVF